MTTSDQYLADRNLRPMKDIPNRDGYGVVAQRRDGREVWARVHAVVGVHALTIYDPHTIYGDSIGWRPA
jgi:hypothetical protein